MLAVVVYWWLYLVGGLYVIFVIVTMHFLSFSKEQVISKSSLNLQPQGQFQALFFLAKQS